MSDSKQQIVFTCCEPSLAVVCETKMGLHCVYKIREALTEKRQVVCGGSDPTSSVYNHSMSASPLQISANKGCRTETFRPFGMSSSRHGSDNFRINAGSVSGIPFYCSEFSGVPNPKLSGTS